MKKSTILIIFMIYLISIVAIGFFGIAVKASDEVLYVQSISMNVRADSKDMYSFKDTGKNSKKIQTYDLTIYFSQSVQIQYERENGITELRNCVFISLIPEVTYDTGDTANAEEESIIYRLADTSYQEKELIHLNERGELMCFKKDIAFRIIVEPEKKGSFTSTVYIDVYVEN